MPEHHVLYDVRIPMRDNVRLAANIYLPHDDGKFPVLLNVTPYGKDSAVRAPVRKQIWAFVNSGYAVVHVDVRGRGNSEGDFLPFFQEIEDGYDTLEWCGSQPWHRCGGNSCPCPEHTHSYSVLHD